jgi:MinD-like ATPase involved in chromosome partitioning or flagellar assembly
VARIIAMHSYRGGTGKSVTAANLAVLIARRGQRVALVDTDLQSPALNVLLHDDAPHECHSLVDFLLGRCEIDQAAHLITEPGTGGNLFLVPARSSVSDIDEIMVRGYDVGLLKEGFDRLAERLALDVLVLDTHAGINNETAASVGIADVLVIVTRADRLDLTGASESISLANRLNCPRRALVVNLATGPHLPEPIRAAVERVYGTVIAGVLPYAQEMAELAGERLLVSAHPDHPLIAEYEKIIEAVIHDPVRRAVTAEPGRMS